jgi:flavorubredoxin
MEPALLDPYPIGRDTHVLPTVWPVPTVGILPINAFLIHAAEPVLVDTGTATVGDAFVDALTGLVKLQDLRWIWLTHEDRDHTGSLRRLLELAPRATVLTTFMAVGRLMPD